MLTLVAATRIVLHNYRPDRFVREEILIALIRLQLDNGGVMSRADFDRWAARRAKVHAGASNNGSQGQKPRKHASRSN